MVLSLFLNFPPKIKICIKEICEPTKLFCPVILLNFIFIKMDQIYLDESLNIYK